MSQRSRYGHRYIAGPVERTRQKWRQFIEETRGEVYLIEATQFIPVLGGCFVVVPESAPWHRSSTSLLQDFAAWDQRRRPSNGKGRSIMVVDDDQATLKLMRIIFEHAGFAVSGYGEAHSALDALEERQEEQQMPDVLVVDLRMPGLDGWGFVREVRARDISSRIVIASGGGASEAQVELGADGAIAKPFDPDDLLSLIQRLPDRTTA